MNQILLEEEVLGVARVAREIARGTYEVAVRLPGVLQFDAGQYVNVSIPGLPVEIEGGRSRDFSMTSKPGDELTFAMRASSSPFKQALLGQHQVEVLVRGPFGIFTLPEASDRPLVFIAGGIGVAPYVSMLRGWEEQPKLPITLLANDSSPQRAAFAPELNAMAARNPKLHIIRHTGRVETAEELKRLVPEIDKQTDVYICGPTGMISQTRALVRELGVGPLQIKIEEFRGYEEETS